MNYKVFDFETTGFLDDPNFTPTQFACKIVKGSDTKEMSFYIKSNAIISEKVTQLTGITQDHIATGETIDYLIEVLDELFVKDKDDQIVGHNIINFDFPIIKKYLSKFIDYNRLFDTAGEYKGRKLGWKKFADSSYYNYHNKALSTPRRGLKFNLALCIEELNIPVIEGVNFHDAMGDVLYTEKLYLKLLEDYINNPQLYIR